jgi:hypothetical protein
MLAISILLIVCGILLIIMTSMGVQCYNQKSSEQFKKDRKSNFNFLVFILVVGILMTLGGIGLLIFKVFLVVHPAGRLAAAVASEL